MVIREMKFSRDKNSKELLVILFCDKLLCSAGLEGKNKQLLVWHKLLYFIDGEYAFLDQLFQDKYSLPTYREMKRKYGEVQGGSVSPKVNGGQ